MPSIMDLALCAQAAYNKHQLKVGSWLKTGASYGNNSFGFFATTYINQKGKELIIAFRGTDDMNDVASDLAILLGQYPNQARHAETAVQDIISKHRNVASIYLTGHSLGGGIASVMAEIFQLPAVTFNAPGMARSSVPGWMPSSVKAITAWMKSTVFSKKEILHIRSDFDLVSLGTGPRMGSVHTIPVTCKSDNNTTKSLPFIVPFSGIVILFNTLGDFVLCEHKMVTIIKAMHTSSLYTQPLDFDKFR